MFNCICSSILLFPFSAGFHDPVPSLSPLYSFRLTDSCSSYSDVVAVGRVYDPPHVDGYNDSATGKPYISTGFGSSQKNVERVEIYRAESEAGTYTLITGNTGSLSGQLPRYCLRV